LKSFPSRSFALIACTLFLSQGVLAESDAPSIPAQIDAMFADWNRSDAPGVAVGVIQNGEFVYQNAFGMADLERRVALTPRSVFEIGSVSKQFTAMCILLLEKRGKLQLDDDIRTYIPEMPVYERPITIRHLLHHTSGIRDIETLYPLAGWPYANYYSEAQQLDLITRQQALNFPPGDQYLYSNSGYLLLATIVHRVSGKTLREFAEERIFRPLGMTHTVFYDTPTQVIPERAIPYSRGEDGSYEMELWYLPFAGPSGLYTSIDDLARWDANFYDNQLGGGAELIETMVSPGILNSGESIDYAAGLGLGDHRGHPIVTHGGAWMGFRAGLTRFPEDRLTVILLGNGSTTGASAFSIADLYLGDAPEPDASESDSSRTRETIDVSTETLADFEGTYWNESDMLLRTLEIRDGALYYVRSEQSATELGAVADGRFVMIGPESRVEVAFNPARDATSRSMTVKVDNDDPLYFRLLEPLPGASLSEYAGTYWSDELDRELQIQLEGSEVSISWADNDRVEPAFQLARDDLLVQQFVQVPWYPQDVRLQFERDGKQQVTGLELSCDMVRGLSFEKLDR
jgi:CubicO group peptidase (beta-lactamase class C family)